MTEKQKMLAGELYSPLDSELVKLREFARKRIETFNTLGYEKNQERVEILKSLFGTTGQNIYVEPTFRCDYGENIHVEENFFANFNCVILDAAEVRFGKNCLLAPQVGIYTATHPLLADERNKWLEYAKPISIGNNCWIGGNVSINPGVNLGDNVVVGSGSVVTKSFGDNVVIGGNPARVLKQL